MKPLPRRAFTRICAVLLLPLATAPAQDANRRLGVFFWHDSANDQTALQGIREGLQAAGLDFEMIVRSADSDEQRSGAMLDELRAQRCQLVFAMGTKAAMLAKERIRDLPIIYSAVSNPVASGVVGSWQGSGSNLAGASNWIAPESVLQAFQRAVPGLQRVGMLRSKSAGVVSGAELQTMRAHLAETRVKVEVIEAVTADVAGIAPAVEKLLQEKVQAIWVPIDITIYQNMPVVLAALGKEKVPVLTTAMQASRTGASVSVFVDYRLLGQRTAALALEVLAGRTAPAAAPVVTLRSYQVMVNLAAARRSGYQLPLPLLQLADVLIDEEVGK